MPQRSGVSPLAPAPTSGSAAASLRRMASLAGVKWEDDEAVAAWLEGPKGSKAVAAEVAELSAQARAGKRLSLFGDFRKPGLSVGLRSPPDRLLFLFLPSPLSSSRLRPRQASLRTLAAATQAAVAAASRLGGLEGIVAATARAAGCDEATVAAVVAAVRGGCNI